MDKTKVLKLLVGLAKTIETDARQEINEFQIIESNGISMVKILWKIDEKDNGG